MPARKRDKSSKKLSKRAYKVVDVRDQLRSLLPKLFGEYGRVVRTLTYESGEINFLRVYFRLKRPYRVASFGVKEWASRFLRADRDPTYWSPSIYFIRGKLPKRETDSIVFELMVSHIAYNEEEEKVDVANHYANLRWVAEWFAIMHYCHFVLKITSI